MNMKVLHDLIFVLSLLSSVILVLRGYEREKRGAATPEIKQALQQVGQWRLTDGLGGNIHFMLALMFLASGITVEYWL